MKKQTDKSNTIIQKSLMDKIWRYLFLAVALICSSVIIFIVLEQLSVISCFLWGGICLIGMIGIC